MSPIKLFRALALTGICAAFSLFATAQSSNHGAVTGVVTASDSNPVATAAITLSGVDGPQYSTTASVDGVFLINNLPSGTYVLKVSSPGFAIYEQPSITVAVGRTTHLSIQLTLANVQQSVGVVAQQSSVDPTQTSSVVNIDRDRVEELPIPSRNYLTFVLLAPQVAAANPALQQGIAQGTGSFSFGGLRPGSNAIYLDEVNDNDEYSGGSRTQLSPEAISDFQIVNHGFAAQSGGGAGGSIDVQTRSGLNRIHGDAFTFVQNGALNGTQPLGFTPYKPDENRIRMGVAIGGPIQHDKTFYYVAAEQEIAHGQEVNDLRPSTLNIINQALKQHGPLPGLNLQTGFFPTTDQETELSSRIDRTLSANEAIMLRYAFTNTRNVNDAFNTDELTDRTARGSSFLADNSLNGTLTSTFSSTLLNKLSFELAQRRAVQKTSSSSGAGIFIPGVALFGTPYSGNSRRFETHLEFADSVSLQRRHHLFQAGGRIDRVALRTSIPDGSQGFFIFPNLTALQTGNADFFIQSFGKNFKTNLSEIRVAAFAQDHWTLSNKLTLDYGIRYDYNHLPTGLPQNALNFSPRLGLAWTPWKATVLRSGFGIFYDRFILSTINRLLAFDGIHGYSQILEDKAAATLYQSGNLPTAPITGVAPSIWRAQPDMRTPYSQVASFSVEQALPLQTTLTGEYQYVHGIKLGRTSNINLPPPVQLTLQNAASVGISSPTAQQLGRPAFSTLRLNPAFDAINQFATSANSTYHGATITLNRQFQDDLQIMAGYTFSKTIDDASSDLEQPQNPYMLGQERGLSLQDQRHRFTLSGLWLIGPDLNDAADAAKNANPSPLMKALTGLEFAPIVSIASGFRANPITGVDSNRQHIFPFASRPDGFSRNSLSTPVNVNVNLRVLKMIPWGRGHLDVVAESFNLLNHQNISLLNPAFGSNSQPALEFARPIAASTARRIQFSLDYEF
ncbi:TonB-dependent receptor [Edaphobacter albus]|uniref:TonB-dependent receptor n=1 Tax=Edaphobacter sp. 4G125 TaxID=2763071 RepID=UPI0016459949|nr:TonB-dependent receptor [Edaphobacter sp. 4G125]QNI36410.1 TonB-dependent receptor [Edaphobacter sp. 4G125]